jgi:hypothetical protein
VTGRRALLERDYVETIVPSKRLINQCDEIAKLTIVDMNKQSTIGGKEVAKKLKSISHEIEPKGMLDTIIVVLECLLCVERRVDIDALDLVGELLLQSLQGQEVVAEDQPVVEEVVVGDPVSRVVGARRLFQEDPGLQARPVLLADPG